MLEMNERKELIERLNSLKFAMREVLESYERLEYSDFEYDVLSTNYPFHLSFDEMNDLVEEWCESSIERLESGSSINVNYDSNGYYVYMVTSDGKAYSIHSCNGDYLNYYNDVDLREYVGSIDFSDLSKEDKKIYLTLIYEFRERGIDYAQKY